MVDGADSAVGSSEPGYACLKSLGGSASLLWECLGGEALGVEKG